MFQAERREFLCQAARACAGGRALAEESSYAPIPLPNIPLPPAWGFTSGSRAQSCLRSNPLAEEWTAGKSPGRLGLCGDWGDGRRALPDEEGSLLPFGDQEPGQRRPAGDLRKRPFGVRLFEWRNGQQRQPLPCPIPIIAQCGEMQLAPLFDECASRSGEITLLNHSGLDLIVAV